MQEISVKCFYDNDQAGFNFEENIKESNIKEVFVPIEQKDFDAIDFIDIEKAKANLPEFYKDVENYLSCSMPCDFKDIITGYNVKFLANKTKEQKRQMFFDDIVNGIYDDKDFIHDVIHGKFDSDFICNPYFSYDTRGYSQGDLRLFVYNQEYKDYFPTQKALHDNVDHLFWDSPVYICITIGDEEIRECDVLDDEYEYDREKVLEKLASFIKDVEQLAIIADLLPEHPEYTL